MLNVKWTYAPKLQYCNKVVNIALFTSVAPCGLTSRHYHLFARFARASCILFIMSKTYADNSTKSWLGQSPPVLAIPVVKRNVLMTPGFFPVIAYDPGFPVIPYDPGFPRDPLRPWISPSSLGAQVAPMAAPFRIVSRTRRRRSSVPVAQVTQWSEFGWSDFG